MSIFRRKKGESEVVPAVESVEVAPVAPPIVAPVPEGPFDDKPAPELDHRPIGQRLAEDAPASATFSDGHAAALAKVDAIIDGFDVKLREVSHISLADVRAIRKACASLTPNG